MKKTLATLATLAITAGATTGVLSGNIITNNSNKLQSHNNLAATDLDSIIQVTNLGNITMAGIIPTKSELLTGIIAANKGASELTTSDFILQDISTPSSVIILGIGNYTGEVFLQYQKQLTGLNTIISTTDLGDIEFSGVAPTKAELLTGIQAVNEGASVLTVDDFELVDTPLSGTAVLIAMGNYSGVVTVQFTQKDTRTDITTLITTDALGEIATGGSAPNKSQLLTAIKAANPDATNLTTADFGFNDNPTTTGVTIYGIGMKFKGEVELTYTVS